jgi:2-polyprenyl-6-hydroxyphenyl methylase/3-demethylubiquinone-9 3-methyltransferase
LEGNLMGLSTKTGIHVDSWVPDDPYHKKLLPPVLQQLRRYRLKDVFEIGSGDGTVAAALWQAGVKVTGVDASQAGIAHANRAFPHLRLEIGSAYDDLASRFGTFDGVIALEVIEHLTDPFLFVRRVRDLLNPGGVTIVSTPYHGYFKNLAISVCDAWDSHWHTLNPPGWHIKFFSPSTLTRILEDGDLMVEKIIRFGRPITPLASGMIAVARRKESRKL